MSERISLKEAVNFHGHLGPYLILGVLAGETALKRLSCKKYFGLEVKVWGANQKPKSCLIDGLQLSTGATYGKGNIKKINGSKIKIEFCNCHNQKRIIFGLKDCIIQRLREADNHKDSEILAREFYKTKYNSIFNLTTNY